MKILVFAAAVTATQVAVIGRLVSGLREDGHSVGERSLPAFRLEKEPTDALVIALTQEQGQANRDRLLELAGTFGEDMTYKAIELPSDPKELEEFDFENLIADFSDDKGAGFISLEQAKAEAVARGLEVSSATTRAELEHMLGIDIHPGAQAGDRISDQQNNADGSERRIGLRTSTPLPTMNGMDITRLNDEQLRAHAVQSGLKVTAGMRRETIINKLMEKTAEFAGADFNKVPKAEDAEGDTGMGTDLDKLKTELEGLTNDELKTRAAADGVDLTGLTKKEDYVKAFLKQKTENGNA